METESGAVSRLSMSCGVAASWEIGVRTGGQLFRIESQRSLLESMRNLIFGVSGAALMLLLIALTAGRHTS